MSAMSTLRRLLWDPGALELAANAIRFFQQADDPEAFRDALAAGDFDRAFAMLDQSDEEIHEQLTGLREQGYEVAERHSDVIEGDMPDELRTEGEREDGR
jgi:hypothetical protein